MNMLELLNPADDHVSEMVHTAPSVLVVETQVDTTSAARSLMMLGTKEEEAAAHHTTKTSPAPAGCYPLHVRSPMLHPAHAASFHMSPVASKTAATATLWLAPAPQSLCEQPNQEQAVAMHAPPAPLRRRLSSISSMLNELELPSSGDRSPVSLSPPASATARPDFCSVTGCLRRPSPQNHGKCAVHKGMKLCQIDGCFRPVQSRGCCKSHGGGARCKHPDCTKGAISKGRCRTHGGGTRCAVPDCSKWAQRFGCCVRHSKLITPKPQLL